MAKIGRVQVNWPDKLRFDFRIEELPPKKLLVTVEEGELLSKAELRIKSASRKAQWEDFKKNKKEKEHYQNLVYILS